MISNQYRKMGVEQFYKQFGDTYINPHETIIKKLLNCIHIHGNILDLACGSGEISNALKHLNVTGIDPYTSNAYYNRIKKKPLPYTFKQITNGCIKHHSYTFIICSYALHLVQLSLLPILCYQLKCICSNLIVITPIKKPIIKKEWGWKLKNEININRIRLRMYQ